MVFDLVRALGVPLTPEIATHIYLAILTDTGSFHYSSISPRTFDICRECLEAGVDPVLVARNVYDSNNMGRLKLFGAVLSAMQIDQTGRIAIVYLDHEMARAAGGTYEDTEGLINLPLTVKEIEAVVFFKQDEGRRVPRQPAVEGRHRHRRDREGVRRRRPQERRRLHGHRRRSTSCRRRSSRRSRARSMDGLLIIDKPSGPTSHDVVARMRRVLRETRIGHTGTLDPMATGVLLLVVGKATRLAKFLSASDKSYDAVVRFGFATDTADAQGQPIGPVSDGAAAVARGDRRRARRVSRHVPAAAAGVLGEEDRRSAQLQAGARDARLKPSRYASDATCRLPAPYLPFLPCPPRAASPTHRHRDRERRGGHA